MERTFGYVNYGFESAEWGNIFKIQGMLLYLSVPHLFLLLDFMILLLKCFSNSLLNWTMVYQWTELINRLAKW